MAALNGDIERDDGSALRRVRELGAGASASSRAGEGRARGGQEAREGREAVASSHTLGPAARRAGSARDRRPPREQRRRCTPTLDPVAALEPYRNAIAGLTHRSEREVTDNRLGSVASE